MRVLILFLAACVDTRTYHIWDVGNHETIIAKKLIGGGGGRVGSGAEERGSVVLFDALILFCDSIIVERIVVK